MFVQGRQRNFPKSVLYVQSLFFFFCIKKCDALLYFGRFRCDHCRRCQSVLLAGGGVGYALKSSWYIRCDPLPSQDFSRGWERGIAEKREEMISFLKRNSFTNNTNRTTQPPLPLPACMTASLKSVRHV